MSECTELRGKLNFAHGIVKNLKEQLAAAQDENERLREALEEYGAHLKTCDMSWGNVPNKCSCGLEQALKGQGKP